MLGVNKKNKKEEKLTFFKGAWKEVELLGSGSYGKVYKAKKEEFGVSTYCAIKRIEIPQTDAEFHTLKTEGMTKQEITDYFEDTVKQWVEEIKFMAVFKDSPNVVNIEDYEVIEKDKKNSYIIHIKMEILKNLDDYVLENNITDKEIIKMAIDVCSALEDCEKNDILHRDIKPDNIFVNKKKIFKVGDFGIAKHVQGTLSNLSKKGTESYMAPELYKNERGNKTVDIYSLGIMLYRYFNYNRLPYLPDYPTKIYPHDREDALYKRISGEKLSPPKNASYEISQIILKACNYYPKNRYQSAAELKEDLQKVYQEIKKGTVLFDFNNRKMEKLFKENSKSLKSEEIEGTVNYFNKKKEASNDDKETEQVNIDNKNILIEEQEKIELDLEKVNISEMVEEDNKNQENLTEQPKIKRSILVKLKTKKILILAIFIFLILIISLCFLLSKPKNTLENEESSIVKMPYLIGKTSKEAVTILNNLDLEIEYEYQEVEDETQAGLILEQSKEKETELKKGTLVKIKIAVSKEKITIISVVGLSLEEAKNKLTELGLQVNVTEQHNDLVEAGKIISQMPLEGEKVSKDVVVDLLVSLGKEIVEIPKPTTKPSTTTKPVNKTWSNWVTSLPSNITDKNYNIETKTEYRYQDKETTTNTSETLDGWIKYNEEATYSEWSSDKTSSSAVIENDTTKIISSRKMYTYYHWKNYYDGMWNVDSIKWGSNSTYCEFSTVWDMPNINFSDKGGKQMVGSIDGCGDGMKGWFKKGSYTETTYQTRTKTMTYYFYRWGNFTDWSLNQVNANENRQVETRILYRYKEK